MFGWLLRGEWANGHYLWEQGWYGSCCFPLGPRSCPAGSQGSAEARHSRQKRAQGHRTGRLGAVSGLILPPGVSLQTSRFVIGSGGGQAVEAGRPVLMDMGRWAGYGLAAWPLPPARHVGGKIISAILCYHWACVAWPNRPIYLRLAGGGRGTGRGRRRAGGPAWGQPPETRARSSVRSHRPTADIPRETCSLRPLPTPVQRAPPPILTPSQLSDKDWSSREGA